MQTREDIIQYIRSLPDGVYRKCGHEYYFIKSGNKYFYIVDTSYNTKMKYIIDNKNYRDINILYENGLYELRTLFYPLEFVQDIKEFILDVQMANL